MKTTLYSVYPEKLELARNQMSATQPFGAFIMPAPDGDETTTVMAGDDKLSYIVIDDIETTVDQGYSNFSKVTIDGRDVAKELAGIWRSHGIFLPEKPGQPSFEEIQAAKTLLNTFFNEEYSRGDASFSRNRNPAFISDQARVAARALNRKPDWATSDAQVTRNCPHCDELIRVKANVCKHCGRDAKVAEVPEPKPSPQRAAAGAR